MLTQFSSDNPLDIDAFSEEFDLRMRFGRGPSSTCSTIPRPTFSSSAPSHPPPPRPGSAALQQQSLPAGRDCTDSMSASQMSDKTGNTNTERERERERERDCDLMTLQLQINANSFENKYAVERDDNSGKILALFLVSILSEICQEKNFVNTFSLFLLLCARPVNNILDWTLRLPDC